MTGKVLVDRKLLEKATMCVEEANIYWLGLIKIIRTKPKTEEGTKILKIAIETLQKADDAGVLSQTQIEENAPSLK